MVLSAASAKSESDSTISDFSEVLFFNEGFSGMISYGLWPSLPRADLKPSLSRAKEIDLVTLLRLVERTDYSSIKV